MMKSPMPNVTPTRSLSSSGMSSRAKRANSTTARINSAQYQTRLWVDLGLLHAGVDAVDLSAPCRYRPHRQVCTTRHNGATSPCPPATRLRDNRVRCQVPWRPNRQEPGPVPLATVQHPQGNGAWTPATVRSSMTGSRHSRYAKERTRAFKPQVAPFGLESLGEPTSPQLPLSLEQVGIHTKHPLRPPFLDCTD